MRYWYQLLLGTGLNYFLVNIYFGNLLNPGFGLAESSQDVIAGASNTTCTDLCPQSDFQTHSDGKSRQKELTEIVFKHFQVFRHPDLDHSAEWITTRFAACLLLGFHNHGNGGGQFEIFLLSYGQVIATLCGTKNTKILFSYRTDNWRWLTTITEVNRHGFPSYFVCWLPWLCRKHNTGIFLKGNWSHEGGRKGSKALNSAPE